MLLIWTSLQLSCLLKGVKNMVGHMSQLQTATYSFQDGWKKWSLFDEMLFCAPCVIALQF